MTPPRLISIIVLVLVVLLLIWLVAGTAHADTNWNGTLGALVPSSYGS